MGPRAVPLLALQHRTARSPLTVGLSILFHIVIVVLLIAPWAFFNADMRAGLVSALTGGGGGGGRGGETEAAAYISVPAPKAPPPSAPTPVPTPVTPPPVQETPVATAPAAPVDSVVSLSKGVVAPGQGLATGPGKGGGSGGGEGSVNGNGSGVDAGPGKGGRGGRGTPPDPRQLILPPNAKVPKALRGKALVVTFWVTQSGDVARVSESPRIEDSDFRRAFEEAMLAYRFRPARDSIGRAVAVTFDNIITLGNR
ncbi:MAG: hypothetical protein ACREL4_08310 [Gemmatimonadales bacterium]